MKQFADLWRGIFFMVSSILLIGVLLMIVLVWQPIWSKGFEDFHTISAAIGKLDQTARPAAAVAPLMLEQMAAMNNTMHDMKTSMLTMRQMTNSLLAMNDSMEILEQINPNISRMNSAIKEMTRVISRQMNIMTGEVDQMGKRFSPYGMLPFNW